MNRASFAITAIFAMTLLFISQSFAQQPVPSVNNPSVKPPQAPAVTAPAAPSAPAASQPATTTPPSGAPATPIPAFATQAKTPAQLIAQGFDEAAFKQQAEAGAVVLLVFSESGDAIWTKQAPVIQGILKEPEFGRIAAYQVDVGTNASLAERFLVKSAGTLILFKGGIERLRSTRMTKPDAVRKMLRLNTAL